MTDISNLHLRFSNTLDRIFQETEINSGIDAAKKNLLSSAILNFTRLLAESPENKGLVEKIKSQNILSSANFENALKETKETFSKNANLGTTLERAMAETLNNFITNLTEKISEEELAKLKEIKNQSFPS